MQKDAQAKLCQINEKQTPTTVLKEMFFINPAGFMLLTDVSGFFRKKKKKTP